MTSPDQPAEDPVSPDLEPYVDLTIDDRDPQDLIDLALADYEAKTGETGFPEGSAEALLLEAQALVDAETIYALNRLPRAMLLVTMHALFKLARDEGAPAWGPVEITVADAGGRLIPAGTQVSAPIGGGDVVVFTLDADVDVPIGELTGAGTVTADVAGTIGNGFDDTTALSLLSPVSFIDAVAFTAPSAGGRDVESDAAFLTRVAQRGKLLSIVLANDLQFVLYALTQPGVFRARAVHAYDPAVGPDPGDNGGHTTVAVLDADGAPLSPAAKATLEAELIAKASADLTVHVVDPTVTAVAVTATVHVAAGNDPAIVQAAVENAIADYLDPRRWLWDGVVRRNELIALIESVPGVDYLLAGHPVAPAADVALPGVAPLADAGAIAIATEGP